MINNHFPAVFGGLVVVREYGAKLLVCASCHGEKGVPQNPTIPVIWGQQENYLLKQLHDVQSGDRNFEVMACVGERTNSTDDESHEGDSGRRPGGHGALHIRPLNGGSMIEPSPAVAADMVWCL